MKRPTGAQILEHLMGRSGEFVTFLERLTLAESPSVVPATQDKVRASSRTVSTGSATGR